MELLLVVLEEIATRIHPLKDLSIVLALLPPLEHFLLANISIARYKHRLLYVSFAQRRMAHA